MPCCQVILLRVFRRKKIQICVVLVVEGTIIEKLGSAFYHLYDLEHVCAALNATFVFSKIGKVNLAF